MSNTPPTPKPAFLDWNYHADIPCNSDFGLAPQESLEELHGALTRTPEEIAKQMIDMLPIEVWNRNTTFLDPCCKSGVFLKYISDRLLVCPDLIEAFPNPIDRVDHIRLNQLFGIAWTSETLLISSYQVDRVMGFNSVKFVPNIKDIMKAKNNGESFRNTLKEQFDRMNFDVVIGNPPYNNDIYLDFVTKGHQVANKYSVWITPAKWQAKGGQKNEDFRKSIVPCMSKIVYYPCCQEIFDIYEADGISYYYIDKNEHKIKTIINKSNIFKVFNSSTNRQINDYWTLYNNVISIIKKCRNDNNKFHFDKYTNNNGIYEVYSANKVEWSSFYTLKEYQKIIGVSIYSYLVDTSNNEECPSADSVVSFRSNNKDECISFGSYIRTKLVRFLISINLLGLTGVIKDEWWRFVPDPANWNLLYEDKPLPNYTPDPETGEYDAIHYDKDNNPVTIRHCSLYVKYHLTSEEINIIESVIKERK